MKPAQKQHVRGAFRDFAKNLFAKPFGQLTTREQGTALTKFYIVEIHNRTTTEIDEDDLEEAIIDGPNDLGLDLIHRDDNVVHLLQCKYFNERSGPDVTDILHFQSVFDRIADKEFAKVIYSFLGDPIKFSGQTSFLFDESENGGYRLIFGDGLEVWLRMPDEEFHLRSAIWWLADEFGRQLKRDREITTAPIERASLERKWFIIHAARLVLQRQNGEEQYRTKLAPYWRGDWRIEDPFFANLYDASKRSVMYVYSTAARKDGFIHRNWMRSGSSVDDLADFIRTAPFMGQ